MNTYQDNYIFCEPNAEARLETLGFEREDGVVEPFDIVDPSQNIDRMVMQSEASVAIKQFLASRTERERRVVRMVFFKEMTRSECARMLGISAAAVTNIIKRVIDEARNALSPYSEVTAF